MQGMVVKGGKALRLGFTTGSCATAASVAAATMLLTGDPVGEVMITLPAGDTVAFSIDNVTLTPAKASCSVKKDAGDDPDVTDGISIFAVCERAASGMEVLGGQGIGVVTAAGLTVPQGEAAINPGPMKMIRENLRAVCARYGYAKGLRVTIAAPEGERLAQKTFNPRLGIVGGISILGTTGIVEPMSEKAVIETIKLLIDKRKLADPDTILITPGNYGLTFCRDTLGLDMTQAVKCANFLGECLDYLVYKQFKRVLLVGHAGKLIKVAGGIMNTHSAVADCRMEIIAAHAACSGADRETVTALMACTTTEEALGIVSTKAWAGQCFSGMLQKVMFHLEYRVRKELEIGVIVFAGETVLMQSQNTADWAGYLAGENV